jgi:hypothetical protein
MEAFLFLSLFFSPRKIYNFKTLYIFQEAKRLAQSQSSLPNGDVKVKPEH